MDNVYRFCYNKCSAVKTNVFYAGLLQNLYMGTSGEVVCSLQFSYQSAILQPFGNYFGKIFQKIADDDNFHMKELAENIIVLGGDPQYCLDSKFLGGRMIAYNKDIKSMFLNNIELKENSIIAYKTTMLKIENKNLTKTLESILKDEEMHLKTLKENYSSITVNK